MKNLTNESLLKFKEIQVYRLLDKKDSVAIDVIEFLRTYYFIEDLNNKTVFSKVFDCVYIKRSKMPKWKLANLCNVSESTLFRIRRSIIDCFNICYNEFKRNTFKAN